MLSLFFKGSLSSKIDLYPPFEEDKNHEIRTWRVFGDGVYRDEYILITPNIPKKKGSLWSKYYQFPRRMIMSANLQIFGQISEFSGFAFWYTCIPKTRPAPGEDFLGGPNILKGICLYAIFKDNSNEPVLDLYITKGDGTSYLNLENSDEPVASLIIDEEVLKLPLRVFFDNGQLDFYLGDQKIGSETIDSEDPDQPQPYFIGFTADSGKKGTALALLSLRFDPYNIYPQPYNPMQNPYGMYPQDEIYRNDQSEIQADNAQFPGFDNRRSFNQNSYNYLSEAEPALFRNDFPENEKNFKLYLTVNGNISSLKIKNLDPEAVFSPVSELINFVVSVPTRSEFVYDITGNEFHNFSSKFLKRSYKIDSLLQNVSAQLDKTYELTSGLIESFKHSLHEVILDSNKEAKNLNTTLLETQTIDFVEIDSFGISPFVKVLMGVSMCEVVVVFSLLLKAGREQRMKALPLRKYRPIFSRSEATERFIQP